MPAPANEFLQGCVITSISGGRPSSLTTCRARRRAGPTASAVSIGPSAQTPKPWAIRAKSGAGSSQRLRGRDVKAGEP
jgi:hypothetical protein